MLPNICSVRKMYFSKGNFTGRASDGNTLTAAQLSWGKAFQVPASTMLTGLCSLVPYIHPLLPAPNPPHSPHRVALSRLTWALGPSAPPKRGITRATVLQRVLEWKVRVGLLDVVGDCYQHFRQLNIGVATKNKSCSQFYH